MLRRGPILLAALLAGSSLGSAAAGDGRFEVLGLGGGGGMFTPSSSPANPKLLLVSCDMSGSYRSLDGGGSWAMIDSMQLRESRGCRPLFAGKAIYWVLGGELRVSRDDAATWASACAGAAPWGKSAVTRLTWLPGDPPLLIVGSGAGVHVRAEGGGRWRAGPAEAGACGGLAAAGETVLAAVNDKLWTTANRGKSWQQRTAAPAGGKRIVALAAGAAGRRLVAYAVAESVGVLRSRDGGASWGAVLRPAAGARGGLVDVVMPPAQTRVAYACSRKEIFRTADGGETWTSCFHMHGPKANVELSWVQTELRWGYYITPLGLGVNPADPNLVLASTQGDLYVSRNGGGSWRQIMNEKVGVQPGDPGIRYRSKGLEVTSVWDFLFDPFDEKRCYIAYTDIGFARSVDRGKTWIHAAKGSPWGNTFYKVVFDPHVKGRMYAAASNRHDIPHWTNISSTVAWHRGGVVISDDHAVRWRRLGKGLPERPCTSLCIDPRSPRGRPTLYAAVFGEGVFKSTDGGRTWEKKSRGLGNRGNLHVLQVEIHPKSGELFCGITAHRHGRNFPVAGGLWTSADGGESWRDVTRQLDLRWATGFALHPADPKTMYLAASTWPGGPQGGAYKTTDGGKSWRRILRDADFAKRRGPGFVHAMNVRLHPEDPDRVYVCAGHGLWMSRDAGKTWRWFGDLPFSGAQNVAFDPKDTAVMYVTTFGGGVWRGPAEPAGAAAPPRKAKLP